jgi:hypothetical protein
VYFWLTETVFFTFRSSNFLHVRVTAGWPSRTKKICKLLKISIHLYHWSLSKYRIYMYRKKSIWFYIVYCQWGETKKRYIRVFITFLWWRTIWCDQFSSFIFYTIRWWRRRMTPLFLYSEMNLFLCLWTLYEIGWLVDKNVYDFSSQFFYSSFIFCHSWSDLMVNSGYSVQYIRPYK